MEEDLRLVRGEEMEDVKHETLNRMLWNTVKKYPRVEAVKYKQGDNFTGLTYEEFGDKIQSLANGLISLGINKGEKIGILSQTRWEWGLADFAVLTAGGVTVSIYPTLPSSHVEYICDNCGSVAVIAENREQLEKILEIRQKLPGLRYIITIENTSVISDDIFTLEEIMERGENFAYNNPGVYKERYISVEPDDLAVIIYTSGTTGLPKGAMLSHWNFRFSVDSVSRCAPYEEGDEMLGFLPMANVAMHHFFFVAVASGWTTCFSLPDRLVADLTLVRPRVFNMVPRLLEKTYQGIINQVESGPAMRKKIFFWAADNGKEVVKCRIGGAKIPFFLRLKQQIAHRLVFGKLRKRLGFDRLNWIISGGALLNEELSFFFEAMGLNIMQVYGMTETAGAVNVNPFWKRKPGTVGPPIPGIMQKIAEDGEILVKGDCVMKGYHNMPEETAASFTEDGWLKTGDIGEFDEDGYLVFRERKKHIIVMSTGLNVAPLPLEDAMKKSPWIEEALVIGDERKFISALLWPDYKKVLDFASENNISFDSEQTEYMPGPGGGKIPVSVDPSLLKKEEVCQIFQREMEKANRNFAPYEQTKKFAIVNRILSLDKGEITPTLKLKRKVVMSNFSYLIEEMYN